jgi:hypothetical protein
MDHGISVTRRNVISPHTQLPAMKNIVMLLGFIAGIGPAFSQNDSPSSPQETMVTGIVTNEKEELLIGASLFWKDTKQGTVTDTEGRFSIVARDIPATLVVHYVGHTAAEVQVVPGEDKLWIEVTGIAQLQEVTVQGKGFDTHISTLGIRNVESITSKELRKAPLLQPLRKFPNQWCH